MNFGTPNLNWSVCNLGASNGTTAESWYGDYYAWGEILPYYADGHSQDDPCSTWRSMTTGAGNTNISNGYAWNSYSRNGLNDFSEWESAPYDNNNILNSGRDAASANWGDGWRMPTSAEWQSLYDNNTFEWLAAGATSTNVESFTAVAAGYLVVKGKESSLDASVYIFLPAAGYHNGTSLNSAGSYGYYWSGSLYSSSPNGAYRMYFYSGYVYPQNSSIRYYGYTVRPVR